MASVFPYRCYAHDNGFFANQPQLARSVWMRIRTTVAPNLTWYATDMEILSPESIHLYVYDMADNFHGGIGKQVFDLVITEFTRGESKMLEDAVRRIYTEAAEEEFERRERRHRELQIINIRKEMFGV